MNQQQQIPGPAPEQIDRLITLFNEGGIEQALAEGEPLAASFPGAPMLQNLVGAVNAAAGNLARAEAHFRQALLVKPDLAEAHYNLGAVLDRFGKTREAIASYTDAIKLKPDFGKAYNDLGVGLQNLGMPEAALASFRKAIHFAPDLAEPHNNLGSVLDRQKNPAEAVASLRRALELNPDYAEAHNNLGNALVHLGQTEDARMHFEAAIRIRPDFAEAHRNLSLLKPYEPADPQLRQMQELHAGPAVSDDDRILLGFALGKAYDDLGRYDEAFAAFAAANRLRRGQLDYSREATRARFDRLVAAFSDAAAPRLNRKDLARGKIEKPVLVLGMPRSGTSLVEQILASHSQVYGAGELELLDQAVDSLDWSDDRVRRNQLHALRTTYLAGLDKLGASERIVTDKMPFNFWWLGFVLSALPEARVIHVVRDARATCWSIFRHHFPDRGIGFTNDFGDIAHYYRTYTDLMAFWHETFPDRILDLDYDALTENQEAETRSLLKRLGLRYEPACLEFHRTERPVQTISAVQVRTPIFSGSSRQWERYEPHLAPLLEMLADL